MAGTHITNRFQSPDEQFCDTTGAPYAGGLLYFYASGTSTPLATYSNQALSSANTNPVVLDSAGRAGSIFLQNLAYKTVLKDVNGVQIWSQDPVETSDFSASAQFQVYPGNPNGHVAGNQGAVGVNPASVVWDSTDSLLYICTTTGTALTAVWTAINSAPVGASPTGALLSYAGSSAPVGWLLCGGQAISRTTYSALFGVTGTVYGVGDGSTTFNIPDLRGRVTAGKDDMNGSAANRITTAGSSIDGVTLGAAGGAQNVVVAQGNLPAVTLATAIAAGQGSHHHAVRGGVSVGVAAFPTFGATANGLTEDSDDATLPAMTGTTPLGGSGTAVNKMPPAMILNTIIKT